MRHLATSTRGIRGTAVGEHRDEVGGEDRIDVSDRVPAVQRDHHALPAGPEPGPTVCGGVFLALAAQRCDRVTAGLTRRRHLDRQHHRGEQGEGIQRDHPG